MVETLIKPALQETRFSIAELQTLTAFSKTVNRVLGEKNSSFVLIGGVALRLLEITAGLKTEGLFAGHDIDAVILSTDEVKRKKLQQELGKLTNIRVDVCRLLTPREGKKAIYAKLATTEDGLICLSGFLGKKKRAIFPSFETVLVDLPDGSSVKCASPSVLFHLMATNRPDRTRLKDQRGNKFRRLLKLNQRLREKLSLDLSSPSDYRDLRELRKSTRNRILPKIACTIAHFINDKTGNPWAELKIGKVVLETRYSISQLLERGHVKKR